MANAKQLIEWVKSKLLDDSLQVSERADFELFWSLMQRRKDLKAGENRQLKKLSEQLEAVYTEEAEDKKGSRPGDWTVTTAMMCELFAVSKVTVANWVKMGMEKAGHGLFDFKKVLPWWLETLYHSPEDKDESITEWRRRERAAKAQQAELQLSNMRGEFIKSAEHEKTITGLCADLRATMLSWPSRVFPNDDAARTKLREEVFNLLDRFVASKSFYVGISESISADQEPGKSIKRSGKSKKKGGKKCKLK